MFAWYNFDYFENALMDELLTTALEWGDYELAIEILEQTGASSTAKDRSSKSIFAKLHLLGIIYDRQGLYSLAEKVYNRALSCMVDEERLDSIEVTLFLKNYSECLRKLNMNDLADGLETVAETFQFKRIPNFNEIANLDGQRDYPIEVANVA